MTRSKWPWVGIQPATTAVRMQPLYICFFFFFKQNICINHHPALRLLVLPSFSRHHLSSSLCVTIVFIICAVWVDLEMTIKNTPCRNTNSYNRTVLVLCFTASPAKFDVSWLVFWSMNQVGGISCLCCFPVIACYCRNPQSSWALSHSVFFFTLSAFLCLCARWNVRYFVVLFAPCIPPAWMWVVVI